MHLSHVQTLLQPTEGLHQASCLAWAPNNLKLAAATADTVVHVFDETGKKRDKFKTKAADANSTAAYLVKGLAFSPDSTKLAVAQSDSSVFVYRLGLDWNEKKSICNKFLQNSPVTSLCWPAQRHNEVVFGLADGKVKLGMLKDNKTYSMYQHPDSSCVVSVAANSSSTAIISGHSDGSIYRFTFPEVEGQAPTYAKLLQHSCSPTAMSWGDSICITGSDCKVVFYDASGRQLQAFDYSTDEAARDFSCCAINPSNDTAVVGAFNRLYVFSLNNSTGIWQHMAVKQVDSLYTTTSLAWKPDGSRVAVGGLTGTLALYDACLRRSRYKGKFELTFVSKSTVVVKASATGSRTVVSSVYAHEIQKVDVYQERFIVARTQATLMLGDLDSCKLSEIPWESDQTERFFFDSEKLCLVHKAGSLSVVEYGSNEVLAVCRTEHMSPYLLSVADTEARGTTAAAKRVAYLLDLQTIRVIDVLAGGQPLATISHDAKLDWLELNSRGSHLMFRDKSHQLHLFNLATQQQTNLLSFCQYVQWVPDSDVVVAQSRSSLYVWYSISNADRMACSATIVPIKGDVEGIERSGGRTEVMVTEGLGTVSYALDEALVTFDTALKERDLLGALATLEPLELTAETRAHWTQLAEAAIDQEALAVAERCYAALGDVAKALYLHKLVKAAKSTGGQGQAQLPVSVRAQLALLSQQWPVAEALLLAQGQVDDAIALYQQAHRWDDAIRVADTSRHPQTEELKRAHFQWLLQTGNEDRAGSAKEREGDLLGAIHLYMKGGLPARAAQVVIGHGGSYDPALLDSIAAALNKAGLQERCGDLYQHLGRSLEALQAYRKAHAYRKAVELARTVSPTNVITLEEEWGDWLASQKQMDAAINHFIEAGCTVKAIEAALADRQCAKAADLLEFLEPLKAQLYYKRIAQFYEEANSREEAESYLLAADAPMAAVDMWMRAGNWEAAQKVARGYLPPDELQVFYSKRARTCEANREWQDAEKAYVAAGQVDMAINMYKANKMWLAMLKLVQQHRREQLQQMHLLVANALQAEGAWHEAERHFCEAKEWKGAVAMYRQQGSWEDALRVAKVLGTMEAAKQVAYAWATSLSEEESVALLRRLNMGEGVVDYAMEIGAFVHAFQLAQLAAKQKLPDVHLKYAMFLEDSGHFVEAEGEFVAAGKPREAIDMYLHNQDWAAAMRVAERCEPGAVDDIYLAQAAAAGSAQQYQLAESFFLKAKRPDAALSMYKEAGQWQAALKLAEAYLPNSVQDIHMEMASQLAQEGVGSLARAQALERGNDFVRAVDAYLSLTPADVENLDVLQQCWEQATTITIQQLRHRLPEVVAAVAQRLVGVGRIAAAADLQESMNDIQGAIQTLCAAGLFERARQLAGNSAQLLQLIEGQHMQHLVASNNAEELASRGNTAAAVEMFAAQGNWKRAHELASQAGPELATALSARHAGLLLRQHDWAAAVAVLAAHGVNTNPANLQLYRDVALEVLAAGMHQRHLQAELQARQMLYQLDQLLTASSQVSSQDVQDFNRLLWAVHLTCVANQAQEAGLLQLAARQLTARLRYVGVIPADRAFFEAGMAWKAAGQHSMAFVILNRFLDMADARDDPSVHSLADLENADFVNTDVPYDVPLPQQPFVTEAAREEARNFVLEVSMDQSIEQALSTTECEHCGMDTFEANLTCHSCKRSWEPCIASGYPVRPRERLVLRSNMAARREEWNTWTNKFHTDPLAGTPAAPMY